MRIYIGFDDTDTIDADRGTGRLARDFADSLPDGCRLWGVVRQQLPRLEGIPYTANNSSACVVVDADDPAMQQTLIERAAEHLRASFIEGSDPGLCVAAEDAEGMARLVEFGRTCCGRRVTQAEAMRAAAGLHLSGHGGTQDGIIGAAAGVGLTLYGWSGRFVDFGPIRTLPARIDVATLEENGIRVLDLARDALVPALEDIVETEGWLRPRLWGGRPVLPVKMEEGGTWRVEGIKKQKRSQS